MPRLQKDDCFEAPTSCYCNATPMPPCGWCSDPARTEAEFDALWNGKAQADAAKKREVFKRILATSAKQVSRNKDREPSKDQQAEGLQNSVVQLKGRNRDLLANIAKLQAECSMLRTRIEGLEETNQMLRDRVGMIQEFVHKRETPKTALADLPDYSPRRTLCVQSPEDDDY